MCCDMLSFLWKLRRHNGVSAHLANPSLNLAPVGRWTLRDKTAQRRVAVRLTNDLKQILKGGFKMKTITSLLTVGMFILCIGLASPVRATDDTYGAAGASKLTDELLTLEKMLVIAIQDEYLARGEYQKVIEKFGNRKPFSNIIKAEKRHISWLKPLFTKYGVALPPDRGLELAKVPATFTEALQIGVGAEVVNISMYERFLKKDLPEDIRDIFGRLRAASKNHLDAFKKGGGSR